MWCRRSWAGPRRCSIGSYVARQFQAARNWPLGAALSVLIIVAMLVAVAINQRNSANAERTQGVAR